jgi:hypothetical protein
VVQVSATAHEKAKFHYDVPENRWRSALVTAFVTCNNEMAKDIALAFNEAVKLVFERYSQQCIDRMAN